MLLVGYFEGISSERGICWRVADSLSLREFTGIGLTGRMPEHSTWQFQRQSTFENDNDATETVLQTSLQGLIAPNGDELREQRSIDRDGNISTSSHAIDRALGLTIQSNQAAGVNVPAVQHLRGGELVLAENPNGSTMTYLYDALGRPTGQIDSSAGTNQTVYAANGQVTYTIEPNGATNHFGYDGQTGRMIAHTNAAGGTRFYRHDDLGNVTFQWGTADYPVRFEYDAYGKMEKMHTYRQVGADFSDPNLVAPVGDLTTWVYDPSTGLLQQKLDAASKGPTYQYDAAGRLTQRTWARGAVTDYTWNNAGQLHTVQYPASTTPGVINSYDRSGRRIQVQDGSGTRVYAYTNGLLAAETWTAGPLAGWKIDRSHDSLRRPTGYDLTQTGSNAQQVAYGYDTISRINQVIGHGITNTYTYAPNRPVLQSLVQGDVQTVSSHEYTYNNRNLRVRADREDGTYWTYSYDAKGQVTGGIKYTAAGQIIPGYVFGYNYDDIGNRVDAIENARQTDYTANPLNQYTQIDRPAFTHIRGAEISTNLSFKVDGDPAQKLDKWWYASPAVSNLVSDFEILAEDPAGNKNSTNLTLLTPSGQDQPQYDNDGNLTQDHLWDYYWSSENRLTGMIHRAGVDLGDKPKLRLSFSYDSQGRRWKKRVEEQNPTTGQYTERYTRYFVYDDWNLIAESAADGSISNTYTWGLDLSRTLQGAGGVGGLLSAETLYVLNGIQRASLPAFDGQGNVLSHTEGSSGKLAAWFEYDPFGQFLRGTRLYSNMPPYRWSTKVEDMETKFAYYGYRYYSPKNGRWINRDPIEEHGGKGLFGFIKNNSQNIVDLFGLRYRWVEGELAPPPDFGGILAGR